MPPQTVPQSAKGRATYATRISRPDGLKTLTVRMDHHCANARQPADAIRQMRGVTKVLYPELPDHPAFGLARKQMSDYGGMVTIELDGDAGRAHRFCSCLKVFSLAESLGGVESLFCHPATMTHASIPRSIREAHGITDSLMRLSVGIEDIGDLLTDIRQAPQAALLLKSTKKTCR